jgi:hypothetical protein
MVDLKYDLIHGPAHGKHREANAWDGPFALAKGFKNTICGLSANDIEQLLSAPEIVSY